MLHSIMCSMTASLPCRVLSAMAEVLAGPGGRPAEAALAAVMEMPPLVVQARPGLPCATAGRVCLVDCRMLPRDVKHTHWVTSKGLQAPVHALDCWPSQTGCSTALRPCILSVSAHGVLALAPPV